MHLTEAKMLAANRLVAAAIEELLPLGYAVSARPGLLVFTSPGGDEYSVTNEPVVLTEVASNNKVVAINDLVCDHEEIEGIELEALGERSDADRADALDPFGFFAELAEEDFYQGLAVVTGADEPADTVEAEPEEGEDRIEQDAFEG